MNIEKNKETFLSILNRVDRRGIEGLIEYLQVTDFFTAPRSTHYHNCKEGGLCEHSLNVYYNLKKLNDMYDKPLNEESMIVVALLHDMAKIDFYEKYIQNRKEYTKYGSQKDSAGYFNWVQVESYKVKDSMLRPNVYSEHGVCSFIMVNKWIELNDEETAAIINHHMDMDKSGYVRTDISEIYNRYPLAALLHIADTMATYLDENPYIINEEDHSK